MGWSGFSFHRTELLAMGFFLLTTIPAVLAQEGLQSCCQPQSGPMLPEDRQQTQMERDILVNLRRNIGVETQLSQLALKHSSNADIMKFSQQILSENRTLVSTLPFLEFDGFVIPTRGGRAEDFPSPNDDLALSLQVPSQTQQARKRMKRLYGPHFDQMYLAQMDAYIKNDRETASSASAMASLPDIHEVGIREQALAEEREARIFVLTAEEHFKIE